MKKSPNLIATIIMLSSACINSAASESLPSALISALQPKAYDFIGLSASPRGNHIMLTQELHKDKLSVVLVYSEDSELKKTDILRRIAERCAEGTLKTFSSSFAQTVDQYLAHKITQEKSQSYDPIVRTENLIALYMKLSRADKPLKQWYKITTNVLAYHEDATKVGYDIIRYVPFRSQTADIIDTSASASYIAQDLQAKKPDRPFHLVIQIPGWEFPRNSTKELKSAHDGCITMHQSSEKASLIFTTVSGGVEYKEADDGKAGRESSRRSIKNRGYVYSIVKKFHEEEKAQLSQLSKSL